ncbi:MAG: F0F1 ATP synthase subunit epsilon [Chloroflexi bacterium AL-W]|nr:F0F1 ATP synthase subunit epsilon [Chloroflexi bacterium AL-N1]NOK64973.1 F0F1 ATP synthase subunit epsilon [Chloroflexi bacterium AL-N10]NOK76743.1 F0F1 ATP synthase subunit epsilon [Chloroflexi bacterium AL-N5]NOK84634.1 F0F1 ATP synthase subunit epsilon [Chloroflexi bacterium AL-W]NOK86541.1 F0F1 ATP synthase subunit epsilon [Chloroflexi bacterium AL-N15]
MPIHLEIVTAERLVLSDDVDMINAPTKDGRVGILPRHSPLLTILEVGELDIVKDGTTTPYAVSGGFMEVLPNRVTILADTAERADEIDEVRAEEARRRAEEQLAQRKSDQDLVRAEAELRIEINRLKVAQLKKRSRR